MSGGSFNYSPGSLQLLLQEVSEIVKNDSPELSEVFRELSEVLYEAVHKLDYHYAADSEIRGFEKFSEQFAEEICLICSTLLFKEEDR